MRNRWKFKKKLSFLNKYINGTNGVISLFLAMLMVPFASIAGVLVNSARINSAVAIFDEALCSASNSTLGTYDEFLRERFGLLAMKQNTASYGEGYSTQQLLQDTFKEYMDRNLKVLSNTYDNSTVSAVGIYPLADTDVLLSEVYEAGKYTVPAKLVIDGLSIEDILKTLTNDLSSVTNVFNSVSSIFSVGDKFGNCMEKFAKVHEELVKIEERKTNYHNSYNEFKIAVEEYNSIIDEINEKKLDIQKQIDEINVGIKEEEKNFEIEKEKVPELSNQIEKLENEKDSNGNKVDNKKNIEKLEEDNKDILKDYLIAKENLKKKQDSLKEKQETLGDIENSYINSLNNKRKNVDNKKIDYISNIDTYASSVLSLGNAVADAQSSIVEINKAANLLITDFAETIYAAQKDQIDNTIKDYNKKKDDAIKSRDTNAEKYYTDEISKLKEKQTEIDNDNTIVKATSTSESTAIASLKKFSEQAYKEQYALLYSNLIELRNKVQNDYIVVLEIKKMDDTSLYYISSIEDILTSDELEEFEKNLSNEICSSSFFTVMTSTISFVKALFKLDKLYNPELSATINLNYYSDAIGGLPSKKIRTDGSIYSLKSPYAETDKEKSDYFKTQIGAYSNVLNSTGSVSDIFNIANKLLSALDNIDECCDKDNWHAYNIWSNLEKLGNAIADIVSSITELLGKALQTLATSIGEKILLSGYIGYNIPNRTTYTGFNLFGKVYSLPNYGSSKQGYAFYGAEAEYIINGGYSEKENQQKTFMIIWAIRLLFNVYPVVTNTEIGSIAGEAGTVTFGIGTYAVYGLYILAESAVDTIILVNGGNAQIKKNIAYLTSTGIIELISSLSKLKLNDEQKNEIYKGAVEVSGVEGLSESYIPPTVDNKILHEINSIDYTQMLIIIMLFSNSNALINRLADVIQMEASYNAATRIDSYVFDLDKSFTYLRASGSFSTNEFIKLSNSSKIYSKERIVYRGY